MWWWDTKLAEQGRLPLGIDGTDGERMPGFEHWEIYAECVLDINLTDERMHQLSLYFNYIRPITPAGARRKSSGSTTPTTTLIDTERVDHFASGKYLSWNVSGHVRVRIYSLDGDTFLTGAFLGPVG